MLSTTVTKTTLTRVTPLFSSLSLSNSHRPTGWTYQCPAGRDVGYDKGRRKAHSMALAVNAATDFFTSSIPTVAQRVKPVGFDEEACTLGLTDGYSYAEVDIGDRFGDRDRYEVMRKLGWGMYATTWLVKDHNNSNEAYYAIKILNHYGTLLESGDFEDPSHPRFHEREVLARVSLSKDSLGSQYCMKLVESFVIQRSTGEHLCLVLELGGMSLQGLRPLISRNGSLPTQFVKMIVKQMCLALEYLHTECKVVHTDLKPSNILVTFSPEDTRDLVNTALKTRPVERYSPRKILGETVEALRSQPLPLPNFSKSNPHTWRFKITDFGSAQWVGRRSTNRVQPIGLRAPEVILGRNWNEKIDIWSLGCLVFEFLTGKTLFGPQGGRKWRGEDDLLANQLEVLSLTQFSSYFCQNSRYALYHLTEAAGSAPKSPERMMYPKSLADALSKHRHAFINTDDTKQERDLALAFIAKCLVLDARDRATASQLLSHPWILNFEFGSKDLPPGLFYKNT